MFETNVIKKLYAINIVLIVSLFYAGLHLNEEEKAFLAGLREGRDAYVWASTAYAIWGVLCTVFSSYVATKVFAEARLLGSTLLLISLGALLFAMMILLQSEEATMQEVLLVYGPYVVFGMYLNTYGLLTGRLDPTVEEGQELI